MMYQGSLAPQPALSRERSLSACRCSRDFLLGKPRSYRAWGTQSVISCRWPMASPGRFEVPGHFQTGRDSTAPKMADLAHGIHG